jgi:hypothetical protein
MTMAALLVTAAAHGQDWTPEENKELNAFQLTMARVKQADRAITSAYEALMADPAHQAEIERRKAIESGELEVSEAEMDAMTREQQEEEAEGDTLAAAVRRIEKEPKLTAALRSVGMSPREFVLTEVALIQAAFAYGAKKQGLLKEYPKEVSPQHIAFVSENEQLIGDYTTRWQKMGEAFEGD